MIYNAVPFLTERKQQEKSKTNLFCCTLFKIAELCIFLEYKSISSASLSDRSCGDNSLKLASQSSVVLDWLEVVISCSFEFLSFDLFSSLNKEHRFIISSSLIGTSI